MIDEAEGGQNLGGLISKTRLCGGCQRWNSVEIPQSKATKKADGSPDVEYSQMAVLSLWGDKTDTH